MKLCLSIAPRTMAEATAILSKPNRDADLIEVRIDGLQKINLKRLLELQTKPFIITNRRSDEGGFFHGSASEQFDVLSEAIQLGAAYIDIEMRWGTSLIKKLRRFSGKTKLIVSHHDLHSTPHNLQTLYRRMRNVGGNIIKIVTTANDISDNREIFRLHQVACKERQPLIALCMGESGQISRILQGKYGGYLTFGSSEDGKATAAGQIPLRDLKKIFRSDTLKSRTKVFGLVGNPVSHSRGIYFHNEVFRRKDADAVYVNFLVQDISRFFEYYSSFTSGFSVTMPYKSAIIPFLDSSDETVQLLRSANTVIRRRAKFYGYNTDALATDTLLRSRISLRGKRVLVLGTGSTAKMMAYAAIRNGAHVTIAGRSLIKAQAVAGMTGCDAITIDNFPPAGTFELLMNGTSVGMKGNPDQRIVPASLLRPAMTVFDAVYTPPDTPLINDARKVGCRVITGAELFKKQATLQSQLFLELMQ